MMPDLKIILMHLQALLREYHQTVWSWWLRVPAEHLASPSTATPVPITVLSTGVCWKTYHSPWEHWNDRSTWMTPKLVECSLTFSHASYLNESTADTQTSYSTTFLYCVTRNFLCKHSWSTETYTGHQPAQ